MKWCVLNEKLTPGSWVPSQCTNKSNAPGLKDNCTHEIAHFCLTLLNDCIWKETVVALVWVQDLAKWYDHMSRPKTHRAGSEHQIRSCQIVIVPLYQIYYHPNIDPVFCTISIKGDNIKPLCNIMSWALW